MIRQSMSTHPEPCVSVVLPVYNAQKYLTEAVSSILNQTFGDFELIAINDGSTDGSLAILESMAKADDRIRIVSRPNTGYTIALNEGIGLARGELIARMDADDISMPDRFEKQVRYLKAHPECVALGGGLLMIDPEGWEITEFCKLLDHESIDAAHLTRGASELGHPAVMMRRKAVVDAGGYRPEFEPSEDLDLWLRLAERGKLANLPEVLLKYRMHAASVSATRRETQLRGGIAAVVDAHRRRGLEVLPPQMSHDPRPETPFSWALLTLESGRFASARHFAMQAIRRQPLSWPVWYTLARVLPGTRHILQFRRWIRARWYKPA